MDVRKEVTKAMLRGTDFALSGFMSGIHIDYNDIRLTDCGERVIEKCTVHLDFVLDTDFETAHNLQDAIRNESILSHDSAPFMIIKAKQK